MVAMASYVAMGTSRLMRAVTAWSEKLFEDVHRGTLWVGGNKKAGTDEGPKGHSPVPAYA